MYPVSFLACERPFFFLLAVTGTRLYGTWTPWLLRQVYELRCCCLLWRSIVLSVTQQNSVNIFGPL